MVFRGVEKEEVVEEINAPPVISDVTLSTERLIAGDSSNITALVTDSDGISEVLIYFQPMGASYWDSVPMSESEGVWEGTLEQLTEPGVGFYIKAIDSLGVYSLYPETGEELLSLDVNPEALTLPFLESFG